MTLRTAVVSSMLITCFLSRVSPTHFSNQPFPLAGAAPTRSHIPIFVISFLAGAGLETIHSSICKRERHAKKPVNPMMTRRKRAEHECPICQGLTAQNCRQCLAKKKRNKFVESMSCEKEGQVDPVQLEEVSRPNQ